MAAAAVAAPLAGVAEAVPTLLPGEMEGAEDPPDYDPDDDDDDVVADGDEDGGWGGPADEGARPSQPPPAAPAAPEEAEGRGSGGGAAPVEAATGGAPAPVPAAGAAPADASPPGAGPAGQPGSAEKPPEVEVDDAHRLPEEGDGEGWLELARDCCFRQLREDSEYPETPPFGRATEFPAAPPELGFEYPRGALHWQLQLLLRTRGSLAAQGKGGPMGGLAVLTNPMAALMAAAAQAGVDPALLSQLFPQSGPFPMMIMEAAKALAASGWKAPPPGWGAGVGGSYGGKGKGFGKDGSAKGVHRTIGK